MELDIAFDEEHGKKILKQMKKDMAFAHSKAAERTILEAVTMAEQSAKRSLNAGNTPMTRGLAKKGPRAGLIRGTWPSRAEVQKDFKRADGVSAEARIYIVNRQESKSDANFDLLGEMHPLVYGGRVEKVNKFPDGGLGVITPTSALMKGLKGEGRLKSLNKYGNIAGLKTHLVSLIQETDSLGKIYLNVPLNSSNPKFQHLTAGLYFRGRELSQGGTLRDDSRTTKSRTGSRSRGQSRQLAAALDGSGNRILRRVKTRTRTSLRKGGAKQRRGLIRNYLVKLLEYHDHRNVKKVWKFPEVVHDVYLKKYDPHYERELEKGVAASRRQGRYDR